MKKADLKKLITRSDGKLNSAVLRQQWFKESDAYTWILTQTPFLGQETKLTERIWCVFNGITTRPLCEVCGNVPAVFLPGWGKGYSKTCSSQKCAKSTSSSKQKRKETMMSKYGALVSPKTIERARARSEMLQVKGRKTLLEMYGVDNPAKLEAVKESKRRTMQKNWGVDYPLQSPVIREKMISANIHKYGVSYPQQNEDIKRKVRERNIVRYDVSSHMQSHNPAAFKLLSDYQWLYHEYIILQKTARQIAMELGLGDENSSTVCRYLHSHDIIVRRITAFSAKCVAWLDRIMLDEQIFIRHGQNVGEYQIGPYSVDGFCAETNTVYEFHGDRWHGNPKVFSGEEYCHPYDPSITAAQLYQKTISREQCIKDHGYNLIVRWETE